MLSNTFKAVALRGSVPVPVYQRKRGNSMKQDFARNDLRLAMLGIIGVTALAASTAPAAAADKSEKARGRYVTGDFHNHTTCSDGTLSLKKLVDKSVDTFGLHWFVQSGHGGTDLASFSRTAVHATKSNSSAWTGVQYPAEE